MPRQEFLLVSDNVLGHIFKQNLLGVDVDIIPAIGQNTTVGLMPTDVAYDPIGQHVYYSDATGGFLARIKIDGSHEEIVVTEDADGKTKFHSA